MSVADSIQVDTSVTLKFEVTGSIDVGDMYETLITTTDVTANRLIGW